MTRYLVYRHTGAGRHVPFAVVHASSPIDALTQLGVDAQHHVARPCTDRLDGADLLAAEYHTRVRHIARGGRLPSV